MLKLNPIPPILNTPILWSQIRGWISSPESTMVSGEGIRISIYQWFLTPPWPLLRPLTRRPGMPNRRMHQAVEPQQKIGPGRLFSFQYLPIMHGEEENVGHCKTCLKIKSHGLVVRGLIWAFSSHTVILWENRSPEGTIYATQYLVNTLGLVLQVSKLGFSQVNFQ